MFNANDFQAQYEAHTQQMAWVSAEAWKFDPPPRGTPLRMMVARALLALAIRLAPAAQKRHAAS